jgi:hypothetical protein
MLKKSHNSWSSAMLGIARRSCSRGFKSLYNPKNSNNNHPGKKMHPNLVEHAWILILEYMMFLHDGILLWNSESESTTCAVMKEGGTQNILSSICQEEHSVHEQSRCRDLMWEISLEEDWENNWACPLSAYVAAQNCETCNYNLANHKGPWDMDLFMSRESWDNPIACPSPAHHICPFDEPSHSCILHRWKTWNLERTKTQKRAKTVGAAHFFVSEIQNCTLYNWSRSYASADTKKTTTW